MEAARGLRRLGRHVLRKRLTGGRGGGFGAAQVLDRLLERNFHSSRFPPSRADPALVLGGRRAAF